MEYTKLSCLDEGKNAVVESIDCKGDMKRRFLDLGLIKGTKVRCVLKSSYNSIKAYSFRGCVIAIRKRDAECVIVKGEDRLA